jgi:hypothetical protein
MHLSNNYDVDLQIILKLPFIDLINFSVVNKHIYNSCNIYTSDNTLIQNKFKLINTYVDEQLVDFDNLKITPNNIFTLHTITTLINRYNITFSEFYYYDVYSIDMFILSNHKTCFISLYMINPLVATDEPIICSNSITLKQMRAFLFHICYDLKYNEVV